MIAKPQFKSIKKSADIGPQLCDDNFNGVPGWIFEAEKGFCYAYELRDVQYNGVPAPEMNGKVCIPLGRDEYVFDTPEEAAKSPHLLTFAIGEGMFPSFQQSIGEAIKVAIDTVSADLMADRAAGDIAPDQVDTEETGIEIIARNMMEVWLQNPPKQ